MYWWAWSQASVPDSAVTTRDSSGNVIGNVRLEVAAGRMVDANTIEVKDARTETALMGVWERMNATESTG